MLSRDLVPIKARMRQPGVDRQAATGWARNHQQPLPIVDVENVGRPFGSRLVNWSHPKIMEAREVSPSSKFFRIWMTLPAPPGGPNSRVPLLSPAPSRSFHLPQGERTRLSGLAPVSWD